jgi:hypothetical protein
MYGAAKEMTFMSKPSKKVMTQDPTTSATRKPFSFYCSMMLETSTSCWLM